MTWTMPGAFRRLNSSNISDLEVGLSRCATKKEIMIPYCTPFEGCFSMVLFPIGMNRHELE